MRFCGAAWEGMFAAVESPVLGVDLDSGVIAGGVWAAQPIGCHIPKAR